MKMLYDKLMLTIDLDWTCMHRGLLVYILLGECLLHHHLHRQWAGCIFLHFLLHLRLHHHHRCLGGLLKKNGMSNLVDLKRTFINYHLLVMFYN
jgi:hypothetical protein